MKVAWICHFSNTEIQSYLHPRNKVGELAPWIPSLIAVLEHDPEIELHIISPHEYIRGVVEFELRGVHYHFFNGHMPVTGRHWPGIFRWDDITAYRKNKRRVAQFMQQIQPDIIHLQGAENAYYSSSVFQFRTKFPIFTTLQGFLHKVTDAGSSRVQKNRVRCELDIYHKLKHFGIRTETMAKVVEEFNPQARFHWHGYGLKVKIPPMNLGVEKQYDLVFFARVTKIKGIEDYLKVVALLKKQHQNIKALVIGSASESYTDFLKHECEVLGIADHVTWLGFLPSQEDVHREVLKAKICVLPVQYDMIPGTIVESMLLKIPVVTYAVGSIPEINEKGEVISIVEKDDISGMAQAIDDLLTRDDLYRERALSAHVRVQEILDVEQVKSDLLHAYKEVILDFKSQHNTTTKSN